MRFAMIASAHRTTPNTIKSPLIGNMFEDRRRVFVDRLGWDVPVVDGRFEMDQYDHEQAVYMVIHDASGEQHLASQRLIPTDRPHLLKDHFSHLCASQIPSGPDYIEATRGLVSPSVTDPAERMHLVLLLSLAGVEYALAQGIKGILGVTYFGLHKLVVGLGWNVLPLGLPTGTGRKDLIATNHLICAASLERVRRRWDIDAPVFGMQEFTGAQKH
jgi:N-acyl-L-homoserine lactone synthetase